MGRVSQKVKKSNFFNDWVVPIVIAVILLELSNRKEKKQDLDDIEKIKEEIRRLREED